MISYFDTSALIPLIIDEPASDTWARLWDEATRTISSRLINPEARAALAQAQRSRRLSAKALVDAVEELDSLALEIDHLEVSADVARSAGVLAQAHALRGHSALGHLAARRASAGVHHVGGHLRTAPLAGRWRPMMATTERGGPNARLCQDDGQRPDVPRHALYVSGAGRLLTVPEITGRVEVTLTVSNPVRSAAWYAALLDMQQRYDYTSEDGRMRYICLFEPKCGLVLCLVGHDANPGEPFSEFRTGLDHLEFVVPRRDDLDDWARRLGELGVEHAGVKVLDYTPNAMLTFRDPDNIQLEFFWRSAPAAD